MTATGRFAHPYELVLSAPWHHCPITWEQPAVPQMRSQEDESWSVIAGLDVSSPSPATSQPCFRAFTTFREISTLS